MKKLVFLSLVLMACGGGSGVDDSKKLSDLSADESKDLCEELADSFPEKTVDCDGQMITIGYDKADCAGTIEPPPASCTATAGDVRDCADALSALSDEQVCTATDLPAACAAISDC
jgi:hypothetical protein